MALHGGFARVLLFLPKKNRSSNLSSRHVLLLWPLLKVYILGRVRAGVDSGVTMRVGGQGYPAPKGVDGARPGDLLVDLIVEPSPVFQRDGADLSMHVPVDFTDAALGTYIKCAPAQVT